MNQDPNEVLKQANEMIKSEFQDSIKWDTKVNLDQFGEPSSMRMVAKVPFEQLSDKGRDTARSLGYEEADEIVLLLTAQKNEQPQYRIVCKGESLDVEADTLFLGRLHSKHLIKYELGERPLKCNKCSLPATHKWTWGETSFFCYEHFLKAMIRKFFLTNIVLWIAVIILLCLGIFSAFDDPHSVFNKGIIYFFTVPIVGFSFWGLYSFIKRKKYKKLLAEFKK